MNHTRNIRFWLMIKFWILSPLSRPNRQCVILYGDLVVWRCFYLNVAVFALVPLVFAHERLNFSQIGGEMILMTSVSSYFIFIFFKFENLAKRQFHSRQSQCITTCCCFSDFYSGGGYSVWDCSLAGMAHISWLRIARFETGCAIAIFPTLGPSHHCCRWHKHGVDRLLGMGDTVIGHMLVFSVPNLLTHLFFNLSV